MEFILDIQGLSKNYGNIQALQDLTLKIPKGSVYGILGPNGSGKTTTLGILLGVINPSSGGFKWFNNHNADESRKRIGALLEQPNFYPYLTGYQNLKVVCDIKGVNYGRINDVLKVVKLYERRQSKFQTYSLGMKQRLGLASVLLADPEVLVLDEPTNGLDPQGIAEVRDLILDIAKTGKTIVIASHILYEVEKVCTHVAVLKKGVCLADGAVTEILTSDDMFELSAEDLDALSMILTLNHQIKSVKKEEDKIIIHTENVTGAQINEFVYRNGIILNHLQRRKKSLEAQFLELTADNNEEAINN